MVVVVVLLLVTTGLRSFPLRNLSWILSTITLLSDYCATSTRCLSLYCIKCIQWFNWFSFMLSGGRRFSKLLLLLSEQHLLGRSQVEIVDNIGDICHSMPISSSDSIPWSPSWPTPKSCMLLLVLQKRVMVLLRIGTVPPPMRTRCRYSFSVFATHSSMHSSVVLEPRIDHWRLLDLSWLDLSVLALLLERSSWLLVHLSHSSSFLRSLLYALAAVSDLDVALSWG